MLARRAMPVIDHWEVELHRADVKRVRSVRLWLVILDAIASLARNGSAAVR